MLCKCGFKKFCHVLCETKIICFFGYNPQKMGNIMNNNSDSSGFKPYEFSGANFGAVPASSAIEKSKRGASKRYKGDFAEGSFFSFNGRIGRVRAIAYIAFLDVVIYFCLEMFASIFVTSTPSFDDSTLSGSIPLDFVSYSLSSLAVVFIIKFIFWLSITVRRLHDLNLSGWWVVLFPIILLVFTAILMHITNDYWYMVIGAVVILASIGINLWPGTKGINDYGLPAEPPSALVFIFVIGFVGASILYNVLQ